jgi:hypothetical protein
MIIGVKNFRSLEGENEFEIRPITILTGPNSSGKSSLMKAIMTMKNVLKPNDNQSQKELYFDANLNIGNFETIINKNSKVKEIEFSLKPSRPSKKDWDDFFSSFNISDRSFFINSFDPHSIPIDWSFFVCAGSIFCGYIFDNMAVNFFGFCSNAYWIIWRYWCSFKFSK